MGGAAAPKAALTARRGSRAGRVTTPQPEAQLTCRLALAHYLAGRLPDAAEPAIALLQPGWSPCTPPAMAIEQRLRDIAATLHDLRIVDPACGQGAFLSGMLDVLCEICSRIDASLGQREDVRVQRTRLSRQLYGVEVDSATAEGARIRLAGEGSGRHPDIAWGDSLVERPIFRWGKRFAAVAARGGFDLVVGNPPYIRHERITDPLGELPPRDYKRQAAAAVHARLMAAPLPLSDRFTAGPLSQRSDLATLFTLLALTLLRPSGVLGFVLPVASFDAQYSTVVHDALHQSRRRAVLLQSCRQRSFPQFEVNTGIFIVQPRSHPPPPTPSAPPIEHVSTEEPLAQTDVAAVVRGGRARISPAGRLQERLAGRITHLRAVGQIRYALKTGINRFFFPDAAAIARFGIEPEYLVAAVKSPRDVRAINLTQHSIPSRLLCCHHSAEELTQRGAGGALAYIRWGEGQVTAGGVPWPLVSSLRGRRLWYAVPLPELGDILCPRFIDRRFFFAFPAAPIPADQTFYDLIMPHTLRDHAELIAALLNCSLSYLWVESHGRTGLGGGVRQYALCDMASLPILDPRTVAPPDAARIVAAFVPLGARAILPVEDEMQQPDREVLDATVAAAMSIGVTEMQSVRQHLVELVAQRRLRARSV